ncbi:MAG: hypothetical protein ACPGU6_04105 [Tenacibaculum sp.]
MKKILFLTIITSIFCSCIFTGNEQINEVSEFNPIILKRKDLDNSIQLQESKPVVTSSKIYIIDDYIFINDKHTGFHIFDNKNPENPIKKSFLKIPGATDIAIKGSICYINQATDLVVLNLNLTNFSFKLEKRIKNVFPELLAPDGTWHYTNEEEIVVNWIKK